MITNEALTLRDALQEDITFTLPLHMRAYATANVHDKTGITAEVLNQHVYGETQERRSSFAEDADIYHSIGLKDPDTRYRVALLGSKVVGFSMSYEEYSDSYYLHGLYVDVDHHSRGIGTALLHDFEAAAAGRYKSLYAVRHAPAYDFYQRHGYKRTGLSYAISLFDKHAMQAVELSKA